MEHKIESAHQFLTMIDTVIVATAPAKDARPILSAIAVEWHDDGPLVVATESHILLASGPTKLIDKGFPPADITSDLIAEPAKLLAWLKGELKGWGPNAELTVSVDGPLSTWRLGDSVHVARILDYATYPNWRQLFAQHQPGEVGTFGLSSATLPVLVKAMAKLPKAGHDSVAHVTFTPGTTALKPILVSAVGNNDTALRGLVMPVRLPEQD